MSDQGVSCRVSKRISINCPVICKSIRSQLIIFSASVEILKNGPTLRKATEITFVDRDTGFFKYQDLIAAVDGLDLTVASIQNGSTAVKCRPGFFLTKTFSFGMKRGSIHGGLYDQNIEHSSNVECRGRYRDYSYKMIDRLMAEELWPGDGAPPLFADIEFLVSGVVFKAHRAIVCARSPVFAAMFASGMRESKTGRVEIKDILTETFADFLKCLHGTTGHAVFRQQTARILRRQVRRQHAQ